MNVFTSLHVISIAAEKLGLTQGFFFCRTDKTLAGKVGSTLQILFPYLQQKETNLSTEIIAELVKINADIINRIFSLYVTKSS